MKPLIRVPRPDPSHSQHEKFHRLASGSILTTYTEKKVGACGLGTPPHHSGFAVVFTRSELRNPRSATVNKKAQTENKQDCRDQSNESCIVHNHLVEILRTRFREINWGPVPDIS